MLPSELPHPSDDDIALKQAFALFSETSEKLSEAYQELQSQVGRLTTELAAANGELARRERLSALGEMAAQVAHQLRTPLATALLYTGHLARPQLKESDRIRFAEKTLGRLRYLERLIQDMLLFVKGAGTSSETFPLQPFWDELIQTVEPQAHQHGISLDAPPLPEQVSLQGDRSALMGAVINLIENAIQATHSGGRVRFSFTGLGSPFAAISVEDEGSGISEEARERLFEPFFTTREGGSGLGLAIVRQVADAHGGWVEWTPRMPVGSRFTIYLPFSPLSPHA